MNELRTDLERLEEAKVNDLEKIQELRDAYDLQDLPPAVGEVSGSNYPKFRQGTWVRLREGYEDSVVSAGATGIVASNPPPGNDWHGFPYVEWEGGKKTHVPDSALEKANPHRNYLRASCSCGRIIRASAPTLDEGMVYCGKCRGEFRT